MFRKTMIRFCIWCLGRMEGPNIGSPEDLEAYEDAVNAFNAKSLEEVGAKETRDRCRQINSANTIVRNRAAVADI